MRGSIQNVRILLSVSGSSGYGSNEPEYPVSGRSGYVSGGYEYSHALETALLSLAFLAFVVFAIQNIQVR